MSQSWQADDERTELNQPERPLPDAPVEGDETEYIESGYEPPNPERWAWVLRPTVLQQRVVIWAVVSAAVTLCATMIVLCILMVVQVS